MKKHTKKLLSVGLSAALVAPLVLSNQGLVNAATTPISSGKIKFVALDDTKNSFVKNKAVKLTKLDSQKGQVVGLAEAWINDAAVSKTTNDSGEATFEEVKAGKYALTMTVNTDTSVTRFVTYTPKATDLVTKVTALPALDDVDKKVSGAIGGTIKGANKTTVAIVGKDTTWTTKTDAYGVFNVFLPAGTYDVIVVGKDTDASTDDKKNTVYKAVKVQAGQTSSPLEQMNATVAWEDGENGFGFTESKVSTTSTSSSFSEISKEYKGTVDRDATVSAYVVDDNKTTSDKTDDVYTLLSETTAKYDKNKKNAPFSLKVPSAQPGKKIKVIVRDAAANTLEKDYTFKLLDPKFTSDSTKAEIGQPIDITFTDVTKTLGSDKLVVKVKVKDANDSSYKTLERSTGTTGDKVKDFSVANGKITINAAYFIKNFAAKAQEYTFSIADTGFDSAKSTVDQTIAPSSVVAPALNVTAEKGTTGTKLKVTATSGTENKIRYVKSSTPPSAPKLYSEAPTSTLYTANEEITGVDAKTTKYLAVYEVNTAGQVVKYKALTLTDKQVVAPVVATDAAALTASLSAGAEGKTKVTLPATGTFKYAKVVSGEAALAKPKVGDAATAYATAIVNAAEVSVAAGDRLYVVEVDSSSKITKWVELTVETADIGEPVAPAN